MVYRKYQPSIALLPFVRCYYVWESHRAMEGALEVHSPPNGLGGMVFNYEDPYQVQDAKGRWEDVPRSFIAGQFTKSYTLRLKGRPGMIGIAFGPAGLANVLGVPMIAFTNLRIELKLVLGSEADQLENRILESKTSQQRITLLEEFLLKQLCKSRLAIDREDYALASIVQQKGMLSISKLSDELCISPRQLRRRFTEKVGVSPKLFSRIKRFNYVSYLSTSASSNWMDIVDEGGYYDQAHFIKDLYDFSGKKPSDFINYYRAMPALIGA
ncbi:AraC-like DNA-binding protein [Neolewinella xylanilytica]|uniref:AraC-like DNA-binding protein n=1 Tax=Neolewinella xylanilytica TaxID=1514080 RepID=A0A2S6I1J9_9BACT|nr:AraC family transcriptional regulator [Neolewinella xylanilytica]PPK84753.1 AraC-like DNA-binding protein [Neolewinella xylanilytica]